MAIYSCFRGRGDHHYQHDRVIGILWPVLFGGAYDKNNCDSATSHHSAAWSHASDAQATIAKVCIVLSNMDTATASRLWSGLSPGLRLLSRAPTARGFLNTSRCFVPHRGLMTSIRRTKITPCLTVAVRPLRVGDLAEDLAVDFIAALQGGIPKLNPNWRWADQHQAVLSTCSSLIATVNDGDFQVVMFSRFSVKEYLISDRLAHLSGDVSRYHIHLEPQAPTRKAALVQLHSSKVPMARPIPTFDNLNYLMQVRRGGPACV